MILPFILSIRPEGSLRRSIRFFLMIRRLLRLLISLLEGVVYSLNCCNILRLLELEPGEEGIKVCLRLLPRRARGASGRKRLCRRERRPLWHWWKCVRGRHRDRKELGRSWYLVGLGPVSGIEGSPLIGGLPFSLGSLMFTR